MIIAPTGILFFCHNGGIFVAKTKYFFGRKGRVVLDRSCVRVATQTS